MAEILGMSEPPPQDASQPPVDVDTTAVALPPSPSHATSPPRPASPPADPEFARVLQDPTLTLNPCHLGFIPTPLWPDENIAFGVLVRSYFQRRNVSVGRFRHKLFNALRISTECPALRRHLGIEWVSPKVLRVEKSSFARLLNIKVIEGGLFHRQGNFPSHGFVEVSRSELPAEAIRGADLDHFAFLMHAEGLFTKDVDGEALNDWKWFNERREKKKAKAVEGD
jgi:hypothetical protein